MLAGVGLVSFFFFLFLSPLALIPIAGLFLKE